MAKRNDENLADVAAQVRRHLESLRLAGVEWLPANAPLPPPADAPEPTLVEAPAAAPRGLFEEPIGPAVAAPPVSAEDRRRELKLLAERVGGCTRCKELAETRTQTVFGVGRIDPDLCFVGEAPGADEDAQGEPFVGKAGQLLTRIIEAMGMKREEVYICNILRCRPPGNRTPLPDEAANCREYLERTLELVRPKFLCVLGSPAAKHLLGATVGITKLRGRFLDYRGIPAMCTFHPAYLLRDPTKKREVWEDMKALLTRMGRPIPGK
jgi:uracil-DNA glycosylase family 4